MNDMPHFATLAIIIANVLFSMKGFKDYAFFEKYKFNIGAIQRGEQIRMLSSGFLHANTTHLLFNMLTLYFFADVIIISLGYVSFLIIYFVSLLVGNLLSFYFHKNNPFYSAIGASGAVTGILYSAILMYPDMKLYLFFALPIKAWIFGIAYLFYSIYGMKKQLGNIGHDAHFGGAIAGYVLTILFAPIIIQKQLWIVLVLAIPIVALFVLMKMKKI